MKFLLAILLCIQGIAVSAQEGPYILQKKISTLKTGSTAQDLNMPNVSFHPGEKMLLAGSEEGILLIINIATGAILHNLSDSNKRRIYDVAFSPDGKFFITVGHQTQHKAITIWNTALLRPVKTIFYDTFRPYQRMDEQTFYPRVVHSLVFSKDGRYFITADADGLINTWKTGTWKLVSSLDTKDHPVWKITMDKQGQLLASSAENGFVKLWKFQEGKLDSFKTIRLDQISCISISHKHLMSGDGDTLMVLDLLTGNKRMVHPPLNDFSGIVAVDFSPDGKYFASGYNENDMKLWSADSFHLVQSFRGDVNNDYGEEDGTNFIVPLFSPTSRYLAMINDAGFIYLYKRKK